MTIALVGGTLIDGTGGPAVPDTTIVVEGDRIKELGPGTQTPQGPEVHVIDVAGKRVIPGLIDGHIHICGEFAPDSMDPFTRLPSYAPLRGAAAARKLLDAGFTSCRGMSDANYAGIALKHAIEHGLVPGPRILASGYGLRIIGNSREWVSPDEYTVTTGMIMGPWEARKAVRMNLLNGADFIELQIAGPLAPISPLPWRSPNGPRRSWMRQPMRLTTVGWSFAPIAMQTSRWRCALRQASTVSSTGA